MAHKSPCRQLNEHFVRSQGDKLNIYIVTDNEILVILATVIFVREVENDYIATSEY